MGTIKYKPTSPGKRQRQTNDYAELTTNKPEKSLTIGTKNMAGRTNQGKLTVRSRGGGNKRKFRIIDFKRNKVNIEGRVLTIEYDPFRTAFISLVQYVDGEKCYILTPQSMKVGDKIQSGEDSKIATGNTLPIINIPVGTLIHNIEISKKTGAKLVRSAGAFATITGRQEGYVSVKLPSGEVRLINNDCFVTIGKVSNSDHRNTVFGKAGAKRWERRRSKMRGAAMNACDHPHGGGEGRAPIGNSSPRSKWGKKVFAKTRNKKKSTRLILKAR
jgi:large subunit ribosomal protein L2